MPRQDISEERRAQILEAALEVFARQGFHEARMDDIAQASGLSKGALYLYYKSKDAIIGALLQTLFDVMLRRSRAIEQEEGSARERILRITQRFADEVDLFSKALPVMLEFYAVAARDRVVRASLGGMLDDYSKLLTTLLRQGIERGELRADDPEGLAIALIAIWEGLTLLWVTMPDKIRWREQATLAVNVFLDGLEPRPTR